ncbi:MAG: DUF885 domain-containing protein [Acidobacteriota bacterium]|nr:DUF885 domain-containing protein [Acidobacteriota bacterium]
MHPSEPLAHYVDDYLGYLHETHPTGATLDGVHAHDDLLEDLGRPAIDAQVRALAGFRRRLDEMKVGELTPVERIEHRILAANVRARAFELEEVRTWERNPQTYADLLATSLAGQALFAYAPAAERARRTLSKLRQVPRLLQAARDNVKEPPGIFVKVGLEAFRGARTFVERDLPRAFADVDDLHLLGDLADAQTEAVQALGEYIDYLERDQAPKARASFRLGREKFERKLQLDEGLSLDSDRLLAIALRELQATQEEFRRAAARLEHGDPMDAWRRSKTRHPEPGKLVQAARDQLAELVQFLERRALVTIPTGRTVTVAPTPDFFRWTSASMWTPGPFETRPVPAYYYLTDVERGWSPERQEEHLRDFNEATLWAISIHEVYPGHFLHYEHLRGVTSKVRKSTMFAPMSFVEGWAHYCEQMMVEAGFGDANPLVRLGQLAEALVRLARFVVCIRLHAEDYSVEQGVRFFREEAFLEEGNARREAERGTFDPTYLVYSVGKLMLLKLRAEYKQQQGKAFSLRTFHDTLLGQGTAPFWAHRQLLLGEGAEGALLERRRGGWIDGTSILL